MPAERLCDSFPERLVGVRGGGHVVWGHGPGPLGRGGFQGQPGGADQAGEGARPSRRYSSLGLVNPGRRPNRPRPTGLGSAPYRCANALSRRRAASRRERMPT
jgi:hypothetical protein